MGVLPVPEEPTSSGPDSKKWTHPCGGREALQPRLGPSDRSGSFAVQTRVNGQGVVPSWHDTTASEAETNFLT